MSIHRIATSRRTVQALLLAGIILLPFLSINSNPAFRMDIGQRTLFMAGSAVRIDQFYLVLLSALVMVGGFLLSTLVLGRVWCGWLCPQTVVNDLVDLSRELLSRFLPEQTLRYTVHIVALLLALAVSFNLLCWFMSPGHVAESLFALASHPVAGVCFFTTTFLMYLNLVLIQRSFCRSYCPYGRFQAALLDEGTLNLAFLEETRDRCVSCNSCVRICPMGIDIRQGFQIECINCGRCIDACRGVMERLTNQNGLIAYRFGALSGSGPRIGTKTAFLTVLVCFFSTALAWGIFARSDTAFSVQRIATAESRTFSDGSQVQAWRAIIGNRGLSPASFSLSISALPGMQAELLGPVTAIRIAPNENRQVAFFIRFNGTPPAHQPFELRLSRAGAPLTAVRVTP